MYRHCYREHQPPSHAHAWWCAASTDRKLLLSQVEGMLSGVLVAAPVLHCDKMRWVLCTSRSGQHLSDLSYAET